VILLRRSPTVKNSLLFPCPNPENRSLHPITTCGIFGATTKAETL